MAIPADIDPPNAAEGTLLDLCALSEAQRIAFYGSMFAIAGADGVWGQDELDVIFQNINTDGLSERGRNTIWEHLVDPPSLADCLASFSSSPDQVRCAVMIYLIEIALADRILAVQEDEALLWARRLLHISPRQIEAIERYICEVGLIRARPGDYHEGATSLKYTYGVGLLAVLSIPAIVLYVAKSIDGVSLPEMLSSFALPGSGRAVMLGAGAAFLIGTAAFLTGRWLHTRYQRKRLPIVRERRRRAQSAVRNLQDAVGYLTSKVKLLAAAEDPSEPGSHTSAAFAERSRVLRQMLVRRQPHATAAASWPPDVPRTSSR
jgi:uncharacterized tellurite resistance protein B-like protein